MASAPSSPSPSPSSPLSTSDRNLVNKEQEDKPLNHEDDRQSQACETRRPILTDIFAESSDSNSSSSCQIVANEGAGDEDDGEHAVKAGEAKLLQAVATDSQHNKVVFIDETILSNEGDSDEDDEERKEQHQHSLQLSANSNANSSLSSNIFDTNVASISYYDDDGKVNDSALGGGAATSRNVSMNDEQREIDSLPLVAVVDSACTKKRKSVQPVEVILLDDNDDDDDNGHDENTEHNPFSAKSTLASVDKEPNQSVCEAANSSSSSISINKKFKADTLANIDEKDRPAAKPDASLVLVDSDSPASAAADDPQRLAAVNDDDDAALGNK